MSALARPRQDFRRLISLYRSGHPMLDALITKTRGILEAPPAFADLAEGRNARSVILFRSSIHASGAHP